MPGLARRVAHTLRRRALLAGSDRVAVAVSGGPDSVALAWVLHELATDAGWRLTGLIHLNHGLRGAESDADEQFCIDLATRLDLPIETGHADVGAQARETGRSVEVAGRDARYAFFDEAARRLGATVVATGHTLDDQAETVLLRLLHGAGTRGLSAIRPRRGPIVRPLIDCRRPELLAWLADIGEAFRTDITNEDVAIPRNRLRRDLMPVIEAVAPGGVRALARLADLAADDEDYLEHRAIEVRSTVVSGQPSGVRLDVEALARLPPALARRVVRATLLGLAPAARLTARHLEAVRRLAAAEKTAGHLDLPGVSVRRIGSGLACRPAGTFAVASPMAPFEGTLTVPGSVAVPGIGVTIEARFASKEETGSVTLPAAGPMVALQASSLTGPLTVRSRRPGDRFRPMGAPGRRKVQDLLVDRKVPRSDRDRVPLVVDANGEIVWVAGVAPAHGCRVTAPETGVVILEMRNSQ